MGMFNSCKKDSQPGQVPNIYVDINIYTTDPLFSNLNPVGGWTYVSGGSKGILVYRKSNTEFMAYERHCPYRPQDPCGQIEVDLTNLQAVDSCCSSKFLLTDGSVTIGPSPFPLKFYQNTFDGNVLHIFN